MMSGCHNPLQEKAKMADFCPNCHRDFDDCRCGSPRLLSEEAAARLHHAAKIIEVDGIDGYWKCRERYGEDIANVLIIASIRRGLGSEDTYPPRASIVEETNGILQEKGLMENVG